MSCSPPLVTFLIPVSALMLSILVLYEKIEVCQFCGMGWVECGLAFIDGRLIQQLRLGFQRVYSKNTMDADPN